jgi:4-hydroxy-tetrahydrodipicolinate synthase
MHPLAGIYAAAVTPLKADFSPDLDAIPPLLDYLARRGCHGALLLGTTGEGPSFAPEEREQILRAGLRIRAAHPTFRLFAGTGTPSLAETVSLTRAAFELGVDGALVLPPYYYRQASEEGLFAYFSDLIRQAVPPDGSLFIYHIPQLTAIPLSLDWLKRLQEAFPRQFAGLKDSSHDADFGRRLGECFGEQLVIFTGVDSFFQSALDLGAAGCITAPANLVSPDLRRVWDAWQAGEDAAHLQQRVTNLRHILEKYPPFPPTLKALFARQGVFPRWPVRPPLVELNAEKTGQVVRELETYDL